jgi:hypothetical protein
LKMAKLVLTKMGWVIFWGDFFTIASLSTRSGGSAYFVRLLIVLLQVVLLQIVLTADCPTADCPTADCPTADCPTADCFD